MNLNYKKEEKIMKDIVKRNVKTTDVNSKLTLIIYYCNTKVNNLIMVNNLTKNADKLSKSHAIYEVTCPRGDCELLNPSYIGQTRNSILTRLNQHKQNGAILEHMATYHNFNRVTLEDLTSNVKILKMIQDPRKLSIYEALVIIDKKPSLNRQVDNFINPLKLFARSNYNHRQTSVALHTGNGTRVDRPVIVNAALSRYSLRSRL